METSGIKRCLTAVISAEAGATRNTKGLYGVAEQIQFLCPGRSRQIPAL